MFIETEDTPNPLVMKFRPGREVSPEPREFTDPDQAPSPLARALLNLGDVTSVFFGPDFVSVTKAGADIDWRHLKAPVLTAIMDHYTSGQPLYDGEGTGTADEAESDIDYSEGGQQVVKEIKSVLDERIRPAVARDGGDIVFDRFEEDSGVVYLSMRGACAGCPSSTMTLKIGVENMLRRYIPEVSRVEAVM